jgi:3-oxoacyl-[acyl-carrier-protein] synthase II
MTRRVVISGVGPVSGLGLGIEPTWQAVVAGRSAVGPIAGFDAAGFSCRIAAEVKDLKVGNFVPKSYRKAVKVMARDIELAVAAADLAARDAQLTTKGTVNGEGPAALSYPPTRVGAHIGAGLIAAELNELTAALVEARNEAGGFDIHRWGREGITHLTPLWLLKYLPNMLACHVTIIHDAQGPSNTITCSEASSGLSIGESLRVIQRGAADLCFGGGAESKLNPLVYLRQQMVGWLNTGFQDAPDQAVRPFCQTAAGTVVGEGGAIVMLEALDTFLRRPQIKAALGPQGTEVQAPPTPQAYCEVIGFGAAQTVHRESRNLRPDPEGRGIALAIRAALREAGIGPDAIDLIVPLGLGVPDYDRAEAAALRSVFGSRLPQIPVTSLKPYLGNCGAGGGGLDVCVAAKALMEQTVPARINCQQPLEGVQAGAAPARPAALNHVLTYTAGIGGQNAALVLKKLEA